MNHRASEALALEGATVRLLRSGVSTSWFLALVVWTGSIGAASAPPPPAPSRTDSEALNSMNGERSHGSEKDPEPTKRADGQPSRTAPGVFEVDIAAGGLVRGWEPQQYPTVEVETRTQGTWHVDVRARIADVIAVHRAYYESSGMVAPRGQLSGRAEDANQAGSSMAWLIGMLGIPAIKFGGGFEPMFRYEALAFMSTAYPTAPVRFVPRDTPRNMLGALPLTTGSVEIATTFETVVAGVRFDRDAFSSAGSTTQEDVHDPSYFVGLGVTSYAKPYMLRVGDNYLDEFLFDARFQGVGLAMGMSSPAGPDRPFLDISGQFGAGKVQIIEEFELSEQLPDGLGVAYLQGNLSGGYAAGLVKGPVSLSLSVIGSVGGMYFYVYEKSESSSSSSSSSSSESRSETLNWDVLWSVGAQALMTL